MAIFTYLLNEKWKRNFCWIIVGMNVINFIIGLYLFAYSIKVHLIVDKWEPFIRRYDFRDMLRLIIFLGMSFILLHLFGMKMWCDLSRPYLRKRFIPAAGPWMVLILLIAIIAFIGGIACLIQLRMIVVTMKEGIKYAMDDYSADMKAKVLVDTIQMRLGCCGGSCYQDWYKIPWKSYKFVTEYDLKERGEYDKDTKDFLQESVPWSCCNPNIHRPCHHNRVWMKKSMPRFKFDVCVYNYGCSFKIMKIMNITMFLAGVLMRTGALIQIAIIIMGRVTYTGIINGLDDFTIPSIGYLFSKGKPRGTNQLYKSLLQELKAGQDDDEDQENVALTVAVDPPKEEPRPMSLSPSTHVTRPVSSSFSARTMGRRRRRLGGGAEDTLPTPTSDTLRRSALSRSSSRQSVSNRVIDYEGRHKRHVEDEQLLTPLLVSPSSNEKSTGRSTARWRTTGGQHPSSEGLRGTLTETFASWLPLSNMRFRLHPGHQTTVGEGKSGPLLHERSRSPAVSNPPPATSLRPFQCGYKKL